MELGVNPDTSDMGWFQAYTLKGNVYKPFIKGYKLENNKTDIPAWSLHRLIEMYGTVTPITDLSVEDMYDRMIKAIVFAIECNDFNEEFLIKK
jgi:hypothetical protein